MTDTPFDPTTVPIKAAATVMMVRDKNLDGSEGLEVWNAPAPMNRLC